MVAAAAIVVAVATAACCSCRPRLPHLCAGAGGLVVQKKIRGNSGDFQKVRNAKIADNITKRMFFCADTQESMSKLRTKPRDSRLISMAVQLTLADKASSEGTCLGRRSRKCTLTEV